MGKSSTIAIILLILAFGGVVAGVLFLIRPTPEHISYTETVPLVKVILATPKTLNMKVEGFGTARAKTEVTLTAEVSGRIIRISPSLRAGMSFNKGDVLLEIDPSTYAIAVKRIKGKLAQQKAEIKRLEQEIKNQEANLKLAKEQLELALKELKRQKNLKSTNVASDIAVERAELSYLESKSRLQTIENTLSILAPRKESAEAGLSVIQAELKEAELNLSKTVIRAPFDGRTAEKYVEEGEFVTIGTLLARIYDTSAIEVPVQLTLEDLQWLDLESTMRIKDNKKGTGIKSSSNEKSTIALAHLSAGEHNYTWSGFVSRIGGEIERATHTILVPWNLTLMSQWQMQEKLSLIWKNLFFLI